jgi:hypothetical protein
MRFIEQDLRGEFSDDRFIHQFVLGPRFVPALSGWQQVEIGPSLKLTAHPGLNVVQASDGDRSLTVIGYMLDPQRPEAGDRDIAQSLLGGFDSLERLIRATDRLGGRWVLVATYGDRAALFNDALGLRQVFFTTPEFAEGVWAFSQPGLLAWLFKLRVDDAALDFLDALGTRNYREFRWPGKSTPFAEITHLLPNRYLDLRTGETPRFWPDGPIGTLSPGEGVASAAELLQGLMDAAYRRFDPVLGMTSGLDSRMVLAASRKHINRIDGMTVRQGQMPDDHPDLTVSAQLLGRLGRPHQVVKALPYMSAAFSKAFKENVFLAHDHYGPDAEAILHAYGRSRVVATGSGAEVARASFRARIDASKSEYTGDELARLLYMADSDFAVHAYRQWLGESRHIYDVHPLDLLCWENLHGNWLAGTQLEFDYAWRDIFTPFNCRSLLVTLLRIEEKCRSAPHYSAFRQLIEKLWPELLAEPINPPLKHHDKGSLPLILRRKAGRQLRRYLSRAGLR